MRNVGEALQKPIDKFTLAFLISKEPFRLMAKGEHTHEGGRASGGDATSLLARSAKVLYFSTNPLSRAAAAESGTEHTHPQSFCLTMISLPASRARRFERSTHLGGYRTNGHTWPTWVELCHHGQRAPQLLPTCRPPFSPTSG